MAKNRQGLNPEEASSTPGAKVKKTKGSGESSNRNVKVRKTDTPKDKSKTKRQGSLATIAKPSTDSKLEQLDQKWSECCNRLEATLLSKTFTQPDSVFQPVVVSPAKPPPAGAVDITQPFYEPQLTK